MARKPDPFVIKETGRDIPDRDVAGFSWRIFEGSSLGEPGLATLRRVISQRLPQLLAWLSALVLLLLAGRLTYLQVGQGEYLRGVAEGNRIRLEVVAARRGLIIDRNGVPLAQNVPSFQLVAVPAALPKDEAERQELLTKFLAEVPTELLHQENLAKVAGYSYLPLPIAVHLPHSLALRLMALSAPSGALRIEVVGDRSYALGDALGHLVGYVGPVTATEYAAQRGRYQLNDVIGKVGLEHMYEDLLRGDPGRREVEVDARGTERKVYATRPSQPGATLQLTIDSRLQQVAYQALSRAVGSSGQRGGSVVVLNPRTGEILALASYPGFNPNLFTAERNAVAVKQLLTSDRRPLFDRAVSASYPAGSIIKPFLAVAGLEERVIAPTTSVLSTGGLRVGNQFFADWKAGGHGLVNVYSAIAESVNTFFYLLGGGNDEQLGLGISRIASYLQRFGFGQLTQIDLPGERTGFIPTPIWKQQVMHDRWYRGDTYNVSIGQGNLLVTPIQVAAAYAALASDGTLHTPHLVRQVVYASGQVVPQAPLESRAVNLSPTTLAVVQRAMRQTVTAGSARSLGSLTMSIAGKTGTAQTGPRTQPHAWFVGYAPAAQPELVVVAMVENGGEGSATAVPIARDIFSWWAGQRAVAAQ